MAKIDQAVVSDLAKSIGDVGQIYSVLRCKQHPEKVLSGNHRIEAGKKLGREIKIVDFNVDKRAKEMGYTHDVMEELISIHAKLQREVGEEERKEDFNELAARFFRTGTAKEEVSAKVVEALKFKWSKSWVLQNLDQKWKSPEKVAAGRARGEQQTEEKQEKNIDDIVAKHIEKAGTTFPSDVSQALDISLKETVESLERLKAKGVVKAAGIVTSPEPPRSLSEIRADVGDAMAKLETIGPSPGVPAFSKAEIDEAVDRALHHIVGEYIPREAKELLKKEGREAAVKFLRQNLRSFGSHAPGKNSVEGSPDGIKISRRIGGAGPVISWTVLLSEYIAPYVGTSKRMSDVTVKADTPSENELQNLMSLVRVNGKKPALLFNPRIEIEGTEEARLPDALLNGWLILEAEGEGSASKDNTKRDEQLRKQNYRIVHLSNKVIHSPDGKEAIIQFVTLLLEIAERGKS